MTAVSRNIKHAYLRSASVDGITADLISSTRPGFATLQTGDGLHFRSFVHMLKRRFLSICVIALVGGTVAGLAGAMLPKKFTAKAEVLVDEQLQESSSEQSAAGRPSEELIGALMDTHIVAISSHDFLTKIYEDLIRRWPTKFPKPSEHLLFNIDKPEKRLSISQERRSRVISVSFVSADPQIAAAVPNRIIEIYVKERGRERKSLDQRELAQVEARISALKMEAENAAKAARSMMDTQNIDAQGGGEKGFAYQRMRDFLNEATSARLLQPILERRRIYLLSKIDSNESDVRILSYASPPKEPSSPSVIFFIIPAFLAFAVIGIFVAVVREGLDDRVRSERDVEELGVACYALLPRIAGTSSQPPFYDQLVKPPFTPASEVLRFLHRLLERASYGDGKIHRCRTMMITSSMPGDGRSTFALALATVAASSKRRVLLIGANSTQILANDSEAPKNGGNHDCELRVSEAVQTSQTLGFDYLNLNDCMEISDARETELLPKILASLRKTYELILFDAPPAAHSGELLRTIASFSDSVLFLIKWGSTRRTIVRAALSQLLLSCDRARGKVGAVITQVDLKAHAKYDFGDFADLLVASARHRSKTAGFPDVLVRRAAQSAKERRRQA